MRLFSQITDAVRINLCSRLCSTHPDRTQRHADRGRRAIRHASSNRLPFDVGAKYRPLRSDRCHDIGAVEPGWELGRAINTPDTINGSSPPSASNVSEFHSYIAKGGFGHIGLYDKPEIPTHLDHRRILLKHLTRYSLQSFGFGVFDDQLHQCHSPAPCP